MLHVTSLGHEAFDHPVEDDTVVVTGAGQFLHPFGVLRRNVGQKLDHDGAVLQLDQYGVLGVLVVGHRALLWVQVGRNLCIGAARGKVRRHAAAPRTTGSARIRSGKYASGLDFS